MLSRCPWLLWLALLLALSLSVQADETRIVSSCSSFSLIRSCNLLTHKPYRPAMTHLPLLALAYGVKAMCPETTSLLLKVLAYKYTSKQYLSYIWSIVTLDNTSQGKTAMLIYEWNDFNRIGMVNNETGQVCYQKGNSSSRMIYHG